MDAGIQPAGKKMKLLYPGGAGPVVQRSASGTAFVQLDLGPQQFVILD